MILQNILSFHAASLRYLDIHYRYSSPIVVSSIISFCYLQILPFIYPARLLCASVSRAPSSPLGVLMLPSAKARDQTMHFAESDQVRLCYVLTDQGFSSLASIKQNQDAENHFPVGTQYFKAQVINTKSKFKIKIKIYQQKIIASLQQMTHV